MNGVFEGLDKLGFNNLPNANALFKQGPNKPESVDKLDNDNSEDEMAQYISLKKRLCPVCGEIFIDVMLRTWKCRYLRSDTDLRAYYTPVDPIYYDVILCHFCGYAAMHSHFDQVSDKQRDSVLNNIKSQYKYKEYPLALSATEAMEQYRLALLCSTIKDARPSEKAMLCLRLAWLARDMKKADQERAFLTHALKGFELAYSNEDFPLYGMESEALCYLMGDLCRRVGRRNDAARYLGIVISSASANPRLKERAADVKEMLKV